MSANIPLLSNEPPGTALTLPEPTLTEEDIAAAVAGDKAAIRLVIRFTGPIVQKAARKAVRKYHLPDHVAEELVQEVYYCLFRNQAAHLALWKPREDRTSALQAYIFVYAWHRILDFLRRTSRDVPTEDDALLDLVSRSQFESGQAATDERIIELRDFIQKKVKPLCTPDELGLLERHARGDSAEEIADSLGSTPAAVLQRLSRLRAKLRKLLLREMP